MCDWLAYCLGVKRPEPIDDLIAALCDCHAGHSRHCIGGARGCGDPHAASKTPVILRELFSGEIRLQPQPDSGLLALWNLQPAALLRAAGDW